MYKVFIGNYDFLVDNFNEAMDGKGAITLNISSSIPTSLSRIKMELAEPSATLHIEDSDDTVLVDTEKFSLFSAHCTGSKEGQFEFAATFITN